MDDVVNFPISLDSDMGRELVIDCVRFAEGILTEQQVRKKYRFDASAWEALGSNEALIEKIEAEKLRRMRDGSTKREKAQSLVISAPDVLGGIMSDPNASPRHRVDAIRTLDSFAANGPAGAPASERFSITINLGADLDGKPVVEHYSKSLAVTPNDIDPNDVDTAPQGAIAAIANKRKDDSDNGNAL